MPVRSATQLERTISVASVLLIVVASSSSPSFDVDRSRRVGLCKRAVLRRASPDRFACADLEKLLDCVGIVGGIFDAFDDDEAAAVEREELRLTFPDGARLCPFLCDVADADRDRLIRRSMPHPTCPPSCCHSPVSRR